MNPIRKLRRKTRSTQTRLAKLGGTSQPTIAAYESGKKSLTIRTLKRLAAASGLEIDIQFTTPLTREERRSLKLHRVIAEKLRAKPEETLKKAQQVLTLMTKKHPSAEPLLQEWSLMLSLPLEELAERLTDSRPHSRELRQVTPFAGVLSARERAEVYRSFSNPSPEEFE